MADDLLADQLGPIYWSDSNLFHDAQDILQSLKDKGGGIMAKHCGICLERKDELEGYICESCLDALDPVEPVLPVHFMHMSYEFDELVFLVGKVFAQMPLESAREIKDNVLLIRSDGRKTFGQYFENKLSKEIKAVIWFNGAQFSQWLAEGEEFRVVHTIAHEFAHHIAKSGESNLWEIEAENLLREWGFEGLSEGLTQLVQNLKKPASIWGISGLRIILKRQRAFLATLWRNMAMAPTSPSWK